MVEETRSLYAELGAEVGISRVVDTFYDRVVSDPALSSYFESVDIVGLRRHQVQFLSEATGGPRMYAARTLTDAHRGLDITSDAFDRVVGHLVASLDTLGVAPATSGKVIDALAPLRDDIVSHELI